MTDKQFPLIIRTMCEDCTADLLPYVYISDLKARLQQLIKEDKNKKGTITSPQTKHVIILNQEDWDKLLMELNLNG